MFLNLKIGKNRKRAVFLYDFNSEITLASSNPIFEAKVSSGRLHVLKFDLRSHIFRCVPICKIYLSRDSLRDFICLRAKRNRKFFPVYFGSISDKKKSSLKATILNSSWLGNSKNSVKSFFSDLTFELFVSWSPYHAETSRYLTSQMTKIGKNARDQL